MKILRNTLTALALTALAAQLSATTVVDVGFDRLSSIASRVVSGEIVSIDAEQDARGYIYSNVTLRVRQAVPSALAGSNYVFRMIGGEFEGRRMFIEGMPRFEVGEEVVLFLNSTPSSILGPTVGVWQGVFRVRTDPATGDRVVLDHQERPVLDIQSGRLVRGHKLTSTAPSQGVAASDGSAPRAMAVERFIEEVRVRRGSTGLR